MRLGPVLFSTRLVLPRRSFWPPAQNHFAPRSYYNTRMGVLSEFLSTSKQKFLADLQADKADDWTVVMGNEAGDLDSVASSLAYSYLATTLQNKPTVPLIQTPRTDLYLRAENLFAFELANLDPNNQDLLCIDDIPSSHPVSSFSKFALVDHNKLIAAFSGGKGKVVAIIDHHADEHAHTDAEVREIVNPVGSCASLVARYFKPAWEKSSTAVPPEVAKLLIAAVAIDTGGLKPDDKGVDIDFEAVAFLSTQVSSAESPNKSNLFEVSSISGAAESSSLRPLAKELSVRKKSVSHLSSRDLLRRDYKEFTYGSLLTGMATVPYGLKDWTTKDKDFWKSLNEWMDERNLKILAVLTTFTGEDKKAGHRREIVMLLRGDEVTPELEKKIWKSLEKSKDLKLETKRKIKPPKKQRARAWNQMNVKATRKIFAPLLKAIIEGGSPAGIPAEEKGKNAAL